mmetsp:Transcript_7694/g.28341  ORF Transcript_7694/g.28341 Transcript_7694/m.28341 type:complete len:261 (+) Transcript_7694:769-1551(+)
MDLAQKKELLRQGFVQLRGAIPQEMCMDAVREVNASIGRVLHGLEHSTTNGKAIESHRKLARTRAPAILDLFHRTQVRSLVESAVGAVQDVDEAQIATRYPGFGTAACAEEQAGDYSYGDWEKYWHIDGLYCPEAPNNGVPKGKVYDFTCLVGILLTDLDDINCGNLAVYPGSHTAVQDYFKRAGTARLYSHGTEALPKAKDARFSEQAHQIKGKAGDVLIAHYLTAHSVAPNTCPFPRHAIYFRVQSSAMRHRNGTSST